MAKKIKKQSKRESVKALPDNMLPQNILAVGERVEENKNIYISQSVYKEIHRFTKNKTTNESGGMLVGRLIEEFGKSNIVISGFIEAKYCEATPTTLKFTHETWDYVHAEMEKKHKDKKIVGWIHTHPDFGIFLSEYDKFIHQNFFSEDHQVAYVVDPIQNIEGFYFWINGNIEKCKGFYIYDRTGVQITAGTEKDATIAEKPTSGLLSAQNILIAALTVVVVFLIFSNISTNNKLEKLEAKQEELVGQLQVFASNVNQVISYMQQVDSTQMTEIESFKDALIQAGIIDEPEDTVDPETGNESDGQDVDDTTSDPDGENQETSGDDTPDTEEGGPAANE